MTGNQVRCLRVSIPYQIVGLGALWCLSVALQTWSSFGGPFALGRWAIMLSGAAAAWTAVIGVRYVMSAALGSACDYVVGKVSEQTTSLVEPVGVEVVRRLELRELEAQVSQLVPSDRRS